MPGRGPSVRRHLRAAQNKVVSIIRDDIPDHFSAYLDFRISHTQDANTLFPNGRAQPFRTVVLSIFNASQAAEDCLARHKSCKTEKTTGKDPRSFLMSV